MSDAALLRSSGSMAVFTAVSRITGFVRILVVAAVLGTTFLGNTYQSANMVPNLVFELFVAGVLQAAMVPTFVGLLERAPRRTAEHVAGSVLGLSAAALAVLAGLGMLLSPLIMRVLVSGVTDPDIRAAQVRLGTIFLLIFLPQVLFYAVGMVATSVLNAQDRFAVPAAAPIVNNVVVVASYVAFAVMRAGKPPSLDLRAAEIAVLAGGTTLGVVAFCAVPFVAVVRSGFSLRPRFDRHHPDVRRIGRLGVWAAVSLAMVQVLLGVVLVLANRVEGGVVAYQIAFAFFLLPHALIAIPLITASFSNLSRRVIAADMEGYAADLAGVVRLLAFFVLPATAAVLALSRPLSTVAVFGQAAGRGAELVGGTLAAFAPGLLGYAFVLLGGRAFAALGDTRTPALAGVGISLGGATAMVGAFAAVSGSARVPSVAAAHSAAYLIGGTGLLLLLRRRIARPFPGMMRPVAAVVGAAVLSCAVMAAVERALAGGGRGTALLTIAVAGSLGAAVYLTGQRLLGGLPLDNITAALPGRDPADG